MANAELRGAVRFVQANLVSPSLLADQPDYQIVFCRNVLIYLDEDARRKALANLHRLLSPNGLLYVGHVEARVAADGLFCRFNAEFPFAFTPANEDDNSNVERRPSTVASSMPSTAVGTAFGVSRQNTASAPREQPRSRPENGVQRAVKTRPVERETEVVDVPTTLAAARLAANAGRLDEATGLCQEILASDPTSVSAIYLLGIVSEAGGDKR